MKATDLEHQRGIWKVASAVEEQCWSQETGRKGSRDTKVSGESILSPIKQTECAEMQAQLSRCLLS